MSMLVIGIDPGLLGGIAVLDMDGNVIDVRKMPETPRDILDHLQSIMGKVSAGSGFFSNGCVCYMEKVGLGMPGQSSKATATFARHNGHLEMALLACGIRTIEATPQKWQKHYQLGKSGSCGKTEWKNKLKALAQQVFPKEKVTLAVADALLIAEYGRKQEIGGK